MLDAVVDTTSDADAVRAAARLLRGHAGAYGFVSGMSVYAPDGPAVPDESAPLRRAGAGYDDVLQERSLKKLACERVLADELDDTPVLVVRVGITTGPRDPSGRRERRRRGVGLGRRGLHRPRAGRRHRRAAAAVVPRAAQIPQTAIDSGAAIAQGLVFRPAGRTAADVLAEVVAQGRTEDLACGWPAERERDLVRRWRARG